MFVPDMPPMPPFVFVPPIEAVVPTAWGTNAKFVACSWCGHRFCYRISRAVAGDKERGEARLRKMLHVECDPVPCSSCGGYQPETVRTMKRERLAGLHWAGLGLLALGAVAWAAAFGLGSPAGPFLASLPAVGLSLVLLRLALVLRFDPNGPAGAEERKAAGKQAEILVPLNGNGGPDFIAGADGTLLYVRYMEVRSLPSQ